MLKFLIDEDLPRSTAKELAKAGFEALDIRDHGLKGKNEVENNRWRSYYDCLDEIRARG